MSFLSSELVLNQQGEVYHLGLSANDISDKIILVGDPGRVKMISEFFESIIVEKSHREFYTIKGLFQGKEYTVISTGIGTDNIDIVINELDVLASIDLSNRTLRKNKRSLTLLRIGTCGILQKEVPVGSFIVSEGAFGLDNVAHFYDIPFDDLEVEKREEFIQKCTLPASVIPYFSEASSNLREAFAKDNCHFGYTITASGFYGPQGRALRLPLSEKGMRDSFTNQTIGTRPLLNFEMESSALFALSRALGHQAGTICLGISNRPSGTFLSDYNEQMKKLIYLSLKRLAEI